MNPLTVERPLTCDPERDVPADAGGVLGTPGVTLNLEVLLWCLVLATAAALRLLDLNAVPLAPAEGLRARAALELSRGTVTSEWGGDLTAALTVLSFELLDGTAAAARLVPALLGVAAIAVLALYRPLLGRAAALVAAVLLAVSPVAVATARTLGPEAGALPLALLVPPLAASVFRSGQLRRAPLLAAVAGFGLGSGALFTGVLVVTFIWLTVESARPEPRRQGHLWRALARQRVLGPVTLLAALPGLLLAVSRYGAGGERLSLASVRAWSPLPDPARMPESWHYVPDVLLAYEPLALLLGAAGAVLALRRWRVRDDEGLRLAVVWAAVGGLTALLWLHHDPGHLLFLTVPLALLGGVATVGLAAGLAESRAQRGLPVLLALLPASGYTLLILLRWAHTGTIRVDEIFSVIVVLTGTLVATIGGARLLGAPFPPLLLLVAWAALGPLTLHAASSVAFRGGAEILTGVRTTPEAEAIVRRLEAAAAPGGAVWVERRLWPALAWPLRERPVRTFVATPPSTPAAVVVSEERESTAPDGDGITVVERWSPSTWRAAGILRWWAVRTPWGPVERLRARVVEES